MNFSRNPRFIETEPVSPTLQNHAGQLNCSSEPWREGILTRHRKNNSIEAGERGGPPGLTCKTHQAVRDLAMPAVGNCGQRKKWSSGHTASAHANASYANYLRHNAIRPTIAFSHFTFRPHTTPLRPLLHERPGVQQLKPPHFQAACVRLPRGRPGCHTGHTHTHTKRRSTGHRDDAVSGQGMEPLTPRSWPCVSRIDLMLSRLLPHEIALRQSRDVVATRLPPGRHPNALARSSHPQSEVLAGRCTCHTEPQAVMRNAGATKYPTTRRLGPSLRSMPLTRCPCYLHAEPWLCGQMTTTAAVSSPREEPSAASTPLRAHGTRPPTRPRRGCKLAEPVRKRRGATCAPGAPRGRLLEWEAAPALHPHLGPAPRVPQLGVGEALLEELHREVQGGQPVAVLREGYLDLVAILPHLEGDLLADLLRGLLQAGVADPVLHLGQVLARPRRTPNAPARPVSLDATTTANMVLLLHGGPPWPPWTALWAAICEEIRPQASACDSGILYADRHLLTQDSA